MLREPTRENTTKRHPSGPSGGGSVAPLGLTIPATLLANADEVIE
jgi:hypothetical protein